MGHYARGDRMSRGRLFALRLVPIAAYALIYFAQASGLLAPSTAFYVALMAFYVTADLLLDSHLERRRLRQLHEELYELEEKHKADTTIVAFMRDGKAVHTIRIVDGATRRMHDRALAAKGGVG